MSDRDRVSKSRWHSRVAVCAIIAGMVVEVDTPEPLPVTCAGGPRLLKVSKLQPGQMLPLYDEPARTANVTAYLDSGASPLVLQRCRTIAGYRYRWCEVSCGGLSGWVDSYHLAPVPNHPRVQATPIASPGGACPGNDTGLL